jgi:peptide/nickel transport system substrate-binding protein
MSALDHLLSAVAAGRVSRRDFVARATALGLSAATIAEVARVLDARAEAEAAGINSLTLNAVQVFGNIDPAIGIDYTQNMANINFYDTLLTPTAAGTLTGRLATSYTASPDARTFTFHLKKGARFHSGNEVTAEDVVYSMQRVLGIGQGPAFVWQGFLDPSGVTAVDRYTVRFHLKQPFAPFPSTMPLLYIVDKAEVMKHQKPGKYGQNGDYGTAYLGRHEAGSGPYTLESDVEGSELRMQKFPGYFRGWGPHSIDEVRVMIVTQEATVVSLAKTGVLDMTSQFQANTTYDTLQRLGFHIVTSPTETVFYLKLNTHIPPTDDLHVRRAMALAFDYNTVRKQILPGAPVGGPLSTIFKDAYNSSLPMPKQNLAAARAELARSRYAGKTNIPLTLGYVSTAPFEAQIALLFNNIMSQLGFKVTLNPQPWNRITQLATKVNQTPNVTEVFYSVIYPSPDSMFFVQYDSKSNGTWASMEWLHDRTVDALIAQSRVTLDAAKRNAIYKQIQARLVQLQTDVFVLSQVWRQAVRKNVVGFKYIPAGTYQFYDLKKLPS